MRRLAQLTGNDPALIVGASGAGGLAGLLAILQDETSKALRVASGLQMNSRVLVIATEGATDPELYDRVVRN